MKKVEEKNDNIIKPLKKTEKKIKKVNKQTIKTIKEEKKSVSFSLVEVIIIVIITGLVISVASGYLIYKNYDKINHEITKKETNTNQFEEFIESYNNILNSYVEKVDEEGLINAAIEGMYNFLEDSYSDYLSKTETDTLQERLNGEYKGIGVEITTLPNSDYVTIVTVFENTPASKAGLKVGDEIISINGEDMKGKDSTYVSTTIKNKSLSSVNLIYKREKEENTVTININEVTIPSIESKIFDKTGYLVISTFSATTPIQFKKELSELENKDINSLIIDVRNNSGGYLSSATTMIECFLEKGDIIYKLKDKNGIITNYKDKTSEKKDYKVIVLINEASASASEILAGALKESYGATLVGKTTYGKGTIQETNTLSSGAMVKYTSAYWLTPKGHVVNQKGIAPDVEIADDISTEKDEVLEKALEMLK